MDLDLQKLRYDLALLYAKSKFELALENEHFSENELNGYRTSEGHLNMNFINEMESLISTFGCAYREPSLTTDDGLLKKMRLKDECSRQDSIDSLLSSEVHE